MLLQDPSHFLAKPKTSEPLHVLVPGAPEGIHVKLLNKNYNSKHISVVWFEKKKKTTQKLFVAMFAVLYAKIMVEANGKKTTI